MLSLGVDDSVVECSASREAETEKDRAMGVPNDLSDDVARGRKDRDSTARVGVTMAESRGGAVLAEIRVLKSNFSLGRILRDGGE